MRLHVGFAYAVAYLIDGDGLAVGRVEWLIHVVDEFRVGVVEGVEFQNDALGKAGSRGTDAAGSGEVSLVVAVSLFDVAHLKDSPVHITIESVAQFLCHVAQVQVVVGYLAGIDVLAEVVVSRIGSAVFDGVGVGQVTICALSCGSTGEDAHFEGTASLVLFDGDFGKFFGHGLGYTGRCESTEGQVFVVLYKP